MVVVKYSFLTAISACLLCASAWAQTVDGVANAATFALQTKLVQLDGVIARFEQQVTNAQGYLVEEASGTLYLAKPRFRWEVSDPFPQIIIADGDEVEIFDPDLEQVTRRTLGNSMHEAPLALLTQTDLALEEHFLVEALSTFSEAEGENSKQARDVLRPRASEALFERIEMTFLHNVLSTLVIYDHTGQQTFIRFADYRAQQVIQSSMFELEYPPGTDFVRG